MSSLLDQQSRLYDVLETVSQPHSQGNAVPISVPNSVPASFHNSHVYSSESLPVLLKKHTQQIIHLQKKLCDLLLNHHNCDNC